MSSPILRRFEELEKRRVSYSGLRGGVWWLFGFIGHRLFRRYPPDIVASDGKRYLNLGSGQVQMPGFVNADFYRLHKLLSKSHADWMLDLTKPLKCRDSYWDGIKLEHVNEHLLFTENYRLLQELFRTLRPGGTLRIVAPDLDHYLRWSDLSATEPKMQRYQTLPEAVSNLTQNHAHVSVWDSTLMTELLSEVGFGEIQTVALGEGRSKPLLNDSSSHAWQSFYLEALKPL